MIFIRIAVTLYRISIIFDICVIYIIKYFYICFPCKFNNGQYLILLLLNILISKCLFETFLSFFEPIDGVIFAQKVWICTQVVSLTSQLSGDVFSLLKSLCVRCLKSFSLWNCVVGEIMFWGLIQPHIIVILAVSCINIEQVLEV